MGQYVTERSSVRYSEAFKLTVIRDIEKNRLSVGGAQKKYDICGSATIQGWLRKYEKTHLFTRKIVIMNIEEQDALTAMRAKVKELESVVVAQELDRHRQHAFYEEALRQLGVERLLFEKKLVLRARRVSRCAVRSGSVRGRLFYRRGV